MQYHIMLSRNNINNHADIILETDTKPTHQAFCDLAQALGCKHWRCEPLDTAARILDHWDAIVNYMDDDHRETVHAELAPCTEIEFLRRYLDLDPDFEKLLRGEFSIDIDDL